jgi:hypothetical protein
MGEFALSFAEYRSPMAGRPRRRARVLAERIARTGGDMPDTWALRGSQLALSGAAAHALLTHHGDVRAALHAIAPNTASLPAAEQRAIARRMFDGNEFMEILRAEIARERERLISRAVSEHRTRSATPRRRDSRNRHIGACRRLVCVNETGRRASGSRPEPGPAVAVPSDTHHDFMLSTSGES